jgi:hypothetical protein
MNVCARCHWRFATPAPVTVVRTPTVIEGVTTSRCPSCSRYTGPDAKYCPHCGLDLQHPINGARPLQPVPRVEVALEQPSRSLVHQVLRLLLTIWLVAYPVVSCAPLLVGSAAGGSSGSVTALAGLLTGAFLFAPWIVGIIVLGLLALLTR